MRYVILAYRLIRHGPRLVREVMEALGACQKLIRHTRRGFLNGELSHQEAAKELDQAINEINDVVDLMKRILR